MENDASTASGRAAGSIAARAHGAYTRKPERQNNSGTPSASSFDQIPSGTSGWPENCQAWWTTIARAASV